jgi:hypothetical protein
MTHIARGFFVAFTALFATIAAYYTLRTTIQSSSGLAAVGSVLWGMMIFMIDRELVGHWSRKSLWIRVVLAAVVGMTVAIPAELRLMQGRIDQQIARDHAVENSAAHQQFLKRQQQIDDRQTAIQAQLSEIQREEMETARNREAEEVGRFITDQTTGVAGRGRAYNAAADRLVVLSQQRADLNEEYHRLADDRLRIAHDYEREQIAAVYDFPSRYEALDTATPILSAMWRVSWLFTLVFIFVDMLPVLMKMVTPATEHDHILAAEVNEKIVRVSKIGQYNEQVASQDFMSHQPSTVDLLERIFTPAESEA